VLTGTPTHPVLVSYPNSNPNSPHPHTNTNPQPHSALSEESIRQTRIASLQKELALLEKDLASATPTTQQTVTQLAQSECLALTTAIMTTLPRELRDMVYRHLSTREHEVIEREHYRTTLDPLTRLYSYNFQRWKTQHFKEHHWDAEFVGAAFLREVVENYYRTSTFIFPSDAGVMKRFLTTDEMVAGIYPKDLVGNAEIHLNAVSRDRGSFRAYMFGVPKTAEKMREGLRDVSLLKEGARVVIRFLTEAKTEKERGEHCAAAMTTLFVGEETELVKKYKVKFVVDEGQVWDLDRAMAVEWAGLHR
jgi:hypothetical protein